MGVQRQFHSVRGDYYGSHFRLGEMAYYVESLEIVAEFFVFAYRNREKQAVVVTSVQG